VNFVSREDLNDKIVALNISFLRNEIPGDETSRVSSSAVAGAKAGTESIEQASVEAEILQPGFAG
jgi:hypothetical protein